MQSQKTLARPIRSMSSDDICDLMFGFSGKQAQIYFIDSKVFPAIVELMQGDFEIDISDDEIYYILVEGIRFEVKKHMFLDYYTFI